VVRCGRYSTAPHDAQEDRHNNKGKVKERRQRKSSGKCVQLCLPRLHAPPSIFLDCKQRENRRGRYGVGRGVVTRFAQGSTRRHPAEAASTHAHVHICVGVCVYVNQIAGRLLSRRAWFFVIFACLFACLSGLPFPSFPSLLSAAAAHSQEGEGGRGQRGRRIHKRGCGWCFFCFSAERSSSQPRLLTQRRPALRPCEGVVSPNERTLRASSFSSLSVRATIPSRRPTTSTAAAPTPPPL
jgi:hypothetical protein